MSARRLAVVLGVLVLGIAGIAGALAFFNARDDATVSSGDGPGQVRPPADDPPVMPGNVVLLFEERGQGDPLRALAADIGGEPTEALEAAGQAVLVRQAANLGTPVRAVTSTHQLDVPSAEDPELREFVEFWLGRAG